MLIFRICVFEEKYSTQQDARVKKDHQRLSRMREDTEKKRSIQQKLRTFKKIGRIHFEKSAITKKIGRKLLLVCLHTFVVFLWFGPDARLKQ